MSSTGGFSSSRGSSPSKARSDRLGTPPSPEFGEQSADERYWTAYIRVGIPIIGLLFMLGLFWYWAASLVGESSNNRPTAPAAALVVDPTQPVPSPTPNQPAVVPTSNAAADAQIPVPTEEVVDSSDETPDTSGTDGEIEDPEDTSAVSEGGTFVEGETAVVTSTDVNMRSSMTTAEENVVTLLQEGDAVTITGPFEEAVGYIWWPVEDADGNTGYIVEDWLGRP